MITIYQHCVCTSLYSDAKNDAKSPKKGVPGRNGWSKAASHSLLYKVHVGPKYKDELFKDLSLGNTWANNELIASAMIPPGSSNLCNM